MEFTVTKTDYGLSPYTGMTRESWLKAAKYLLENVFSNIKNFTDPVVVPRTETEITYPHVNVSDEIAAIEESAEREFLNEYFSSPEEVLKNVFLKGYEWPFDVRKIYGSSFIDLLVYRETVVNGCKVYMDFTREPKGLKTGLASWIRPRMIILKIPMRSFRCRSNG